MPTRSDAIAVVTVHGTGDTAAAAAGEKWFQQGSSFTERVKQRLGAAGVPAEIVPHLWTGANSARDRELGADALAKTIKKCAQLYAGVHVIGHSHGGNVANDAAILSKWGRRRNKERIQSLISVGTPFFDQKTGPLQVLAGLLFLALTWISVLMFVPTAIALIVMFASGQAPAVAIGAPFLYVFGIGACLWFMLHISRRGVRRILRPRGGAKLKVAAYAIWHQNDEAISFLQRVETLPLEPFPRGSMFRSSRGGAISWGVIGVIFLGLVVPILHLLGIDVLGLQTPLPDGTIEQMGGFEMFGVSSIIAFWFTPIIFVVIYLLYRYIVGGFSEIGLRGVLNRWVTGILRGTAMGRDGDQILCKVSTASHSYRTEEHILQGDVAARMQEGANGAAERLIGKYRWALFTVGEDANTALTKLTTDAMTWDSLIHTTYFDQPEVADLIADYIARRVREPSASGLPPVA